MPSTPPVDTEPARAHAVDLVLLGRLLASRLIRDGVTPDLDFARIWQAHVVPAATAGRTEWRVGMCAEIAAELETSDGSAFTNVVGRIVNQTADGWQLVIQGPDGMGGVEVDSANLKSTSRPAAVIGLWRSVPLNPSPYTAVREAGLLLREAGPLPVTVLSGFLGAGKTSAPLLAPEDPLRYLTRALPDACLRRAPALLNHMLNNRAGYRIAVVVNDMAHAYVDGTPQTESLYRAY